MRLTGISKTNLLQNPVECNMKSHRMKMTHHRLLQLILIMSYHMINLVKISTNLFKTRKKKRKKKDVNNHVIENLTVFEINEGSRRLSPLLQYCNKYSHISLAFGFEKGSLLCTLGALSSDPV